MSANYNPKVIFWYGSNILKDNAVGPVREIASFFSSDFSSQGNPKQTSEWFPGV